MKFRYTLFLAGALALAACNGGTSAPADKPAAPQLDPKGEEAFERKAGDHCFFKKESNESTEGRLTLGADGSVNGNLRGTVVDQSSGAEAVSNTSFVGALKGDTLYVQVQSDRTGARTAGDEKWIWRAKLLSTGAQTLDWVPCK